MLCVIPVSAADADLIQPFSLALHACGKNVGFKALVVVRPGDKTHAEKLMEAIDGAFDSIDLYVLPNDGVRGWPQGPNHYWCGTIRHLMVDRRNTDPWLWCELDCTPLKPGWLKSLLTEYNLVRKPFMGVICTTYATNPEKTELVDAGRHMVGAGIYPPNMGDYSQLWPYTGNMTQAFDYLIQWEVVPHMHDTPLMQHGFRTQDYTVTDGVAQGKDSHNFPCGIRFDQAIRPEVVLHHGCDDGSLARAVFGEGVCGVVTTVEETIPEAPKVFQQAEMPFLDTPAQQRPPIPTVDTSVLVGGRGNRKAKIQY